MFDNLSVQGGPPQEPSSRVTLICFIINRLLGRPQRCPWWLRHPFLLAIPVILYYYIFIAFSIPQNAATQFEHEIKAFKAAKLFNKYQEQKLLGQACHIRTRYILCPYGILKADCWKTDCPDDIDAILKEIGAKYILKSDQNNNIFIFSMPESLNAFVEYLFVFQKDASCRIAANIVYGSEDKYSTCRKLPGRLSQVTRQMKTVM